MADGRTISFKEAMARFTDTTGRPGPAAWELGSFPEEHAELPVTGVSWYEAAAYADVRRGRRCRRSITGAASPSSG